MIKKSTILRTASLALLSLTQVNAGDKTNKTFVLPRSSGYELPMQLTRWHTHTKDHSAFGGHIQMIPFFQQSTNGSKLGQYFTFANKKSLSISQTSASTTSSDVHSYNFNLPSEYVGSISFKPKREVYGMQFAYMIDLHRWLKHFYFVMSSPVINVKHRTGFKETITTPGTTTTHSGPQSVQAFLRGDRLTSDFAQSLMYGKIDGNQSESGMADTELKFGYIAYEKKQAKIAVNIGCTVPTGNRPEGVYMFEPVVGNGHHWALGGGFESSIRLWHGADEDTKHINLILSADYRYLLEADQTRTLELKGKNWGRFIRMRQADPRDTTRLLAGVLPGINAMTRKVKVTPGSQVEGVASLCFKATKYWHFGLGYNIWARESESVKLKGSWTQQGQYGLYANDSSYQEEGKVVNITDSNAVPVVYTPATPPAKVNQTPFDAATPTSSWTIAADNLFPKIIRPVPSSTGISSDTTISTLATGNGNYIAESDVDKCGSPAAVSHKIFGNIDYTISPDGKYPFVIGLMGNYEFAQNNAAISQWEIGLKLGTAF